MGGMPPLFDHWTFGLADVQTRFRSIPCLFIFFHTLLHPTKTQLVCFQMFPHSLPKTTRGGGYPPANFAQIRRIARNPEDRILVSL